MHSLFFRIVESQREEHEALPALHGPVQKCIGAHQAAPWHRGRGGAPTSAQCAVGKVGKIFHYTRDYNDGLASFRCHVQIL